MRARSVIGGYVMPRKAKPSAAPPSRNADASVLAAKADRLARDPVFREFFDACHQQHIADLEAITLDGTEKAEKEALSALYRFQALMDMKRTIYQPLASKVEKRLQERDS